MKTSNEWISLFETVIGRTPSREELEIASATNFDPKAIVPISEGKYPEIPATVVEEAVSEVPSPVFEQSEATSETPAVPTAQAVVGQAVSQPQMPVNATSAIDNEAVPSANQYAFMQEETPAKDKETIVLPIISFVVSGLTIILSFIVKSPFLLISLAFIALIMGILSFVLNVKRRKKVLSIIALPLSIFTLIVGVSAAYIYTLNNLSSVIQESSSDSNEDWKEDFDDVFDGEDSTTIDGFTDSDLIDEEGIGYSWTEKELMALDVANLDGETDSDQSGISLDDFISKYGKATDGYVSDGYASLDYDIESDDDDDAYAYASFTFEENDEGAIVLSDAYLSDIPGKSVEIKTDYKSDWTTADYDALNEADEDDDANLTKGSKWSDILKKHGNPTEGRYSISRYSGKDKRYLNVTYEDIFASGSDKLTYVSLEFMEKDGEYYLTSKYHG